MNKDFKLEEYLSNGVENIVKGAVKASLHNPKESTFIAKYALSSRKSRRIRQQYEEKGEHIPPFLIASITSTCNLHCKGCYARANQSCVDHKDDNQLTDEDWGRIFQEASELGISFILLAGGEPMIRREVIERAAKYKNIIFPIFTNGTMLQDSYLSLFDKNRNLIPVISLEGDENTTDSRRGIGVYNHIVGAMEVLNNNGILYGVSVTVTKENIQEVVMDSFLQSLKLRGCKLIFYVEYVPVTSDTKDIAPTDEERAYLDEELLKIRQKYTDMIFIAFPGDEKSSGGCLAAGRGFFHINPHGGAEPCPFSPYSDTNLRDVTLMEALQSPLFQKLQNNHILMREHQGGCVLFEQSEQVEALLGERFQ